MSDETAFEFIVEQEEGKTGDLCSECTGWESVVFEIEDDEE